MEMTFQFIFDSFVTDDSGSIGCEDMKTLYHTLQLCIPDKEFQLALPSTTITFDEFVDLLSPLFEDIHHLVDLFRSMDRNHDDFISGDELKQIFAESGVDVEDEAIAQIIRQIDLDNDHRINFKELMMAGSSCFLQSNPDPERSSGDIDWNSDKRPSSRRSTSEKTGKGRKPGGQREEGTDDRIREGGPHRI